MKPDTSRWRESFSYDFFDALPVEGLAWECLRRDKPYQSLYRKLVSAKAETAPLPKEAERRWGLRFRGQTWVARNSATRPVVAADRFGDPARHRSARSAPTCTAPAAW